MLSQLTKNINRLPKTLINSFEPFKAKRKHSYIQIPTISPIREEATEVAIEVFDYNSAELKEYIFKNIEESKKFHENNNISWINVAGLRKKDVEEICKHFGVHYLITEDILSVDQRPKMDELDNILYCLLNMLYYNEQGSFVEQEQISIVLGKNFVLSFQEEANKDVFNSIRDKLKVPGSRVRNNPADYLCYSLIDMIVDNYYTVLEKVGEQIESLEEEIIHKGDRRSLPRISKLRKELIGLKRNFGPVREIVNGFIRSDSDLLEEKTTVYFKDVYDHIVQANDLVESYRDIMINMQDLYLNKVNLKLNEAMKVMAIATCLMAPATVIGGIFGMNFTVIPLTHQQLGFYIAVGVMIVIPAVMIISFKKRGWF